MVIGRDTPARLPQAAGGGLAVIQQVTPSPSTTTLGWLCDHRRSARHCRIRCRKASRGRSCARVDGKQYRRPSNVFAQSQPASFLRHFAIHHIGGNIRLLAESEYLKVCQRPLSGSASRPRRPIVQQACCPENLGELGFSMLIRSLPRQHEVPKKAPRCILHIVYRAILSGHCGDTVLFTQYTLLKFDFAPPAFSRWFSLRQL